MNYLIKNAAAYGYTLTEEMYKSTLGLAGEKLRQKMISFFGSNYPMDDISHITRGNMHDHMKKHGIPLKHGILSLLKHLKLNNIPCAVASSSPQKYVEEYLTSAGIIPYFDIIIGGDQIEHSKPAPDIFLKALDMANKKLLLSSGNSLLITAGNCIVLEDSQNGIDAAYNASIPIVCIPDLVYPDEEHESKCVLMLKSADELIPYII